MILKQIGNKIRVFSPENIFILIWDQIMLFLILTLFFITPVQISFDTFTINTLLEIATVFWIFDVVISINRGFFKDG